MTIAITILVGAILVAIVCWACAWVLNEWRWRDATRHMEIHRTRIPDDAYIDFWGRKK